MCPHRSHTLPQLYELWLSSNSIGDDGVCALAAALSGGAFAGLGDLRLQYNRVSDRGVRALMAAPLPNLWYLGLSDNCFTDAALRDVEAALVAGAMPRLEFLTVLGAGLSTAAEAAVQTAINDRRRRTR